MNSTAIIRTNTSDQTDCVTLESYMIQLFENRYLSSCQKEFASNSGSTNVAFMIRAARTALQI